MKTADLATEARFENFEGLSRIGRIALSPDGKTLAVDGWIADPSDRSRNVLILWDILKQRRRLVIDHRHGFIEKLVFSPDGQSVVTASSREGKLCDLGPARRVAYGKPSRFRTRALTPDHGCHLHAGRP